MIMAALGLLPVTGNTAVAQTQSQVEDGTQGSTPNIIFIMCDDMGYGDLGCYGQQRIETPNLDRMASQGMRFTQAYAGSPVSAPSRASFMTGQHTGHTHVRGNREYWRSSSRANMYGSNSDYSLIGQEPYLMNHKIIPEVMKEAGYNTGMFGKWAGGYYNTDYPNTYLLDANGNSDTSKSGRSSSASLPNKRGVDCYYGYICQFQAHTYYPNFLNRYDPEKYGDKHIVVDTLKQNIQHKDVASGSKDYENREQYASDLIHQYALEWIDRQTEDKPFIGIFTYTLPHAELWQPNDSLVAKYTERFKGQDSPYGGNFGSWYYRNYARHAQFAAMVNRLDMQIGEIFDKLKEKGFDENTLVIFTSDNGPHEEGGADPAWFNRDGLLKGTKRSTHEGGIRVPFIAKGPGVPAGSVNDHQLAFYDVMPTLLDYAGLDGKEYSREASTEERRYDGISFNETLTGNDAKQEKHEFLYWEFHETNMMALRMCDWKLVVKNGTPHLYDLSRDLHEDEDVAAQYPDIVARMVDIVHREHTESSMFQVTLPAKR
jgi:arylsulfatase A-like enzyme